MSADQQMAMEHNHDAAPVSVANRIKQWAPIGVIAVAMLVAFQFGVHEHFSLSNLIMQREALQTFVADNIILALLAYVALYAVSVALSFPGASFITIAAGFLFGWVAAGFATVIGATIGATIIFLAARTSFGTALRDRAGPFMKKLSDGFRENAFSYLLFLRLTPLFPFWVINLAPALFNVPLQTYVAATFLGIIPGTFAYAFVGAGLDSVIAAQEAANPGCAAAGTCQIEVGSLITPELIFAFAALGVVSLAPVLLKRMRKPQNQSNEA